MKIISLSPKDDYGKQLYKELDDYNLQFGVDTAIHEDFLFAMQDDNGKLLGGIQGRIFSGWLLIYSLYSTREVKGIGTQLMDHIEQFARNKNCKGIQLTTFEFQAPEFYKKRGYEIYGELSGFVGDYKNIYMKKLL